MSEFLYAEINITGIVLLLLMLNNMKSKDSKNKPFDQWLFNNVMLLNLLIFLFDTGMWLVDGKIFPLSSLCNNIVTTGYYILNPFICFVWLMYTDIKIYESRSGLLKRARFYVIPSAISAILSLISPFTGWYFIIDEVNRYKRGHLFPIMLFFAFSYLATSFGIAVNDARKNGWEENKSLYLHLVVFPFGILTAIAIQTLFFGVSIIWVCTMLACASIYINIQNGEISIDHLTGLYNRRRLDQYLYRKVKVKREGWLLFAIILDLDKFKNINDTYGHLVGDNALVQTAKLLRQICTGKDDFISRLGGDEFIIIGERTTIDDIEQLTEEIHSKSIEFNKKGNEKYTLSLSVGFSIFGKGDTMDTFLAAADVNMYNKKQKHKLV